MAFAIDHQGLIEANSTTNGGYKLNCLMRETFSKELSAQDITPESRAAHGTMMREASVHPSSI